MLEVKPTGRMTIASGGALKNSRCQYLPKEELWLQLNTNSKS